MADAASTVRKATIAAVERLLGVPQATFYRNFASLVPGFQQRADAQTEAITGPTPARRSTPARATSRDIHGLAAGEGAGESKVGRSTERSDRSVTGWISLDCVPTGHE